MSTSTKCNYCLLRQIREEANKKGHRTLKMKSTDSKYNGWNILSYPKGTKVPPWGTRERPVFNTKYFVAWLMELTAYCVCDED